MEENIARATETFFTFAISITSVIFFCNSNKEKTNTREKGQRENERGPKLEEREEREGIAKISIEKVNE